MKSVREIERRALPEIILEQRRSIREGWTVLGVGFVGEAGSELAVTTPIFLVQVFFSPRTKLVQLFSLS